MSDINPDRDDTPLVSVSRYASAQTDLEEMIGARVGAYRIVGELGRGGMGAVYLAERAVTQITSGVERQDDISGVQWTVQKFSMKPPAMSDDEMMSSALRLL